jgi:hypothetical protein
MERNLPIGEAIMGASKDTTNTKVMILQEIGKQLKRKLTGRKKDVFSTDTSVLITHI